MKGFLKVDHRVRAFAARLPGSSGWALLEILARSTMRQKSVTVPEIMLALGIGERTATRALQDLHTRGVTVVTGSASTLAHDWYKACDTTVTGLVTKLSEQPTENTVTDASLGALNEGKEVKEDERRKTTETSSSVLSPNGLPGGNSPDDGEAKLSIKIEINTEPERPTPDPESEPDQARAAQAQAGKTQPGFEDVPARPDHAVRNSALEPEPEAKPDPAREKARAALERILAGNPNHASQLEHVPAWLEAHPSEYILAVVNAVTSGRGVQISGLGMLFTALNSPASASVPDDLKTGRMRLERGLTFALTRRRGWYRTADGRDVYVHRWTQGDAQSDGRNWPVAATRLWECLPADHVPFEESPEVNDAPEESPRLSPDVITRGRQQLEATRAQVRASRTAQGIS